MTNSTRSAHLSWSGEGLKYHGTSAGAAPITVDGDSKEGPSPMGILLLSLAGCMAIDIQSILEKGRVPFEALEVDTVGTRAPEPPRRFTRIEMEVRVRGVGPEDEGKLDRAIALSRDRYCSVFHTLQPDLEVEIRTRLD